jgi:hypothetical protein
MKNITNHKRKPGRPTKSQSAAIAYLRSIKESKKKHSFQLNFRIDRELNQHPAANEFILELRASGRGLLAQFAKEALIKAAISATK